MLEVKSLEELYAIHDPKDRELVKVWLDEENYKYYCYIDGEWMVQSSPELKVSLYDLNKQVYSGYKPMSKEKITSRIRDYAYATKADYYMLLSNEFKYYTIFATGKGQSYNPFKDEVIDLLLNDFDDIVEITDNKTYLEIWGHRKDTFGVYMLFDYTGGVIECR